MTSPSCQNAIVSIGVPVFNGEPYLEEALRSILGQTYANLEVIVSDNASLDRSAEIAADYAEMDDRIRFTKQAANRGAAANFNWVFDHASGRYFRWAPADDKMAPELIERCVAALEADPDLILAYPETELIDKEGNHLSNYSHQFCLSDEDVRQRGTAFILGINLCDPVLGVYRRERLAKTQLIQAYPGADAVLLFESALAGRAVSIEEYLFQRRVHEGASHEANPSLQTLQAWFGPRRLGLWSRVSPRIRLLYEYLRVISRCPERNWMKFQLTVRVVLFWSYRQLRVHLGAFKRRIRSNNYRNRPRSRFENVFNDPSRDDR